LYNAGVIQNILRVKTGLVELGLNFTVLIPISGFFTGNVSLPIQSIKTGLTYRVFFTKTKGIILAVSGKTKIINPNGKYFKEADKKLIAQVGILNQAEVGCLAMKKLLVLHSY
jgi:hypothetical protein